MIVNHDNSSSACLHPRFNFLGLEERKEDILGTIIIQGDLFFPVSWIYHTQREPGFARLQFLALVMLIWNTGTEIQHLEGQRLCFPSRIQIHKSFEYMEGLKVLFPFRGCF